MAKREIRKLSRSTHLLFPKRPFQRLVREIAQDYKDIRFTTGSMQAIQVRVRVCVCVLFGVCYTLKRSVPSLMTCVH